MRQSRKTLIAELESDGFRRSASGAEDFWREYRKRYRSLPDVVELEKKRPRRAQARRAPRARRLDDYAKIKARLERCRAGNYGFTPIQEGIARAIVAGLTNPEIAAQEKKNLNTIKFHVSFIYAKAKVTKRSELIYSWHRGTLPLAIRQQLPPSPQAYKVRSGLLPIGASN